MSVDLKQSKPQTPDQIVAVSVIEALQNEGLLRGGQANTFGPKLVAGKLSAEDWSLEIELALNQKGARA